MFVSIVGVDNWGQLFPSCTHSITDCSFIQWSVHRHRKQRWNHSALWYEQENWAWGFVASWWWGHVGFRFVCFWLDLKRVWLQPFCITDISVSYTVIKHINCKLTFSAGTISCLEFYGSSHLLSGGQDGLICVWSTKKWECLKSIKAHK